MSTAYERHNNSSNPFRHELKHTYSDNPQSTYPQLRLDSAVEDKYVKKFLSGYNDNIANQNLYEKLYMKKVPMSYFYQHLMISLWVHRTELQCYNDHSDTLLSCIKTGYNNYYYQYKAIIDPNLEKIPENILTKESKYINDNNYFTLYQELEKIIILMSTWQTQKSEDLLYKIKPGIKIENKVMEGFLFRGWNFMMTFNLLAIYDPYESKYYVLEKTMIQAIYDCLTQRFNAHLTTTMANLCREKHIISHNELNFIFSWGDNILKENVKGAYNIIKNLEGLCIALQHKSTKDEICDPNHFYEFISKSLGEELTNYSTSVKEYHNNFVIFLTECANDKHKISQIFGLYRSWMHPAIDEVAGIIALRKISQKPKFFNNHHLTDLRRTFIKEFIISYWAKHQTWPKLKYIGNNADSNKIWQRYKKGITPFLEDITTADIELDDIAGDKTFDINPTYNLATLISDKTLAPHASKIIENVKHNLNLGSANDRRVVMVWLRNKIENAIVLLNRISNGGIKDDEKVILLKGKERELKEACRLFSMLTIEIRLYFVITEDLLSTHLLPYFPQITTNDNLVQLTKKIRQNTRRQAKYPGKLSSSCVIVNIDFAKWNSNFRNEVTSGIFTFIDELLGFPQGLINKTHDIFSSCWVMLSSGKLPTIDPNLNIFIESPWTYPNHLGGVEGIRQKGWTLITVMILKRVCTSLGMNFQIMGQGDNQVLILHFPELDNMTTESYKSTISLVKQKIEDLKTLLPKECEIYGLPLKMEETWFSSTFFIYGKFPVSEGVPTMMYMKKLLRLSSYPNESYPSLETAMSSISANGMQSNMSSISCAVPFSTMSFHYALALISHGNYSLIYRKPLYCQSFRTLDFTVPSGKSQYLDKKITINDSSLYNMSHENLQVMCLFSRSLGGYPIMLLPMFILRDFPDDLSSSVSLLNELYKIAPNYMKRGIISICSPPLNPFCQYKLLVEDVQSINILLPTSPSNFIKSKMRSSLVNAGFIKNDTVNSMRSALRMLEGDEIYDLLMKIRPVHPRVLNALISATLPHYASKVINQVQNTKTVVEFFSKSRGFQILRQAGDREFQYWNCVWSRFQEHNVSLNYNPMECATAYCKKLRHVGWQLEEIHGITIPHPIHAFKMNPNFNKSCHFCELSDHTKNYVSYRIVGDISRHKMCCSVGPMTPYLGSKTSQKVEVPYAKNLVSTDPLFKLALQAVSCLNWFVDPNDNLGTFIQNIFNAVSELPARMFIPPVESISGAAAHRFADEMTKHGGHSTNSFTPYTHINYSTNTLYDYQKSKKNTDLHFQALTLTGQSIVSHLIYNEVISTQLMHYHQTCDCISEINEEFLTGPEELKNFQFPTVPSDSNLFIPKTVLKDYSTQRKLRTIKLGGINDNKIRDLMFSLYLSANLVRKRMADDLVLSHIYVSAKFIYYIRCNPVLTLNNTIRIVATHVLDQHFVKTESYLTRNILIQKIREVLNDIPIQEYIGYAQLLLYEDTRKLIASNYEYYIPLTEHPPREQTLCEAIKQLLIASCEDVLNSEPKFPLLIFNEFTMSHYDVMSMLNYQRICNLDFLTNHQESNTYVNCLILLREQNLKLLDLSENDILALYTIHNDLNMLHMMLELYRASDGWCEVSVDTACKIVDNTIRVINVPRTFSVLQLDSAYKILAKLGALSVQNHSIMFELRLENLHRNINVSQTVQLQQRSFMDWRYTGTIQVLALSQKIVSIAHKLRSAIVFGDKEGQTSLALFKLLPDIKISSHNYYDDGKVIKGSYTHLCPALIEIEGLEKRLLRQKLIDELPTDLTDTTAIMYNYGSIGRRELVWFNIPFNILLNEDKFCSYSMSIEQLLLMCKPKCLIVKIKIFYYVELQLLVALLRTHFSDVELVTTTIWGTKRDIIYIFCTKPYNLVSQYVEYSNKKLYTRFMLADNHNLSMIQSCMKRLEEATQEKMNNVFLSKQYESILFNRFSLGEERKFLLSLKLTRLQAFKLIAGDESFYQEHINYLLKSFMSLEYINRKKRVTNSVVYANSALLILLNYHKIDLDSYFLDSIKFNIILYRYDNLWKISSLISLNELEQDDRVIEFVNISILRDHLNTCFLQQFLRCAKLLADSI